MKKLRMATLAVAIGVLGLYLLPGALASGDPDTTPPSESATQPPPKHDPCPVKYRQDKFKVYAKKVYRRDQVSAQARSRLNKMLRCAHSEKASKNMARFLDRTRQARKVYRASWKFKFDQLPAHAKAWARSTSACESGNRRIARESGFLSYFQWVLSTWHAAGGSGNPEYSADYYEQAVRAWFWHLRYPRGQWPNCGE